MKCFLFIEWFLNILDLLSFSIQFWSFTILVWHMPPNHPSSSSAFLCNTHNSPCARHFIVRQFHVIAISSFFVLQYLFQCDQNYFRSPFVSLLDWKTRSNGFLTFTKSFDSFWLIFFLSFFLSSSFPFISLLSDRLISLSALLHLPFDRQYISHTSTLCLRGLRPGVQHTHPHPLYPQHVVLILVFRWSSLSLRFVRCHLGSIFSSLFSGKFTFLFVFTLFDLLSHYLDSHPPSPSSLYLFARPRVCLLHFSASRAINVCLSFKIWHVCLLSNSNAPLLFFLLLLLLLLSDIFWPVILFLFDLLLTLWFESTHVHFVCVYFDPNLTCERARTPVCGWVCILYTYPRLAMLGTCIDGQRRKERSVHCTCFGYLKAFCLNLLHTNWPNETVCLFFLSFIHLLISYWGGGHAHSSMHSNFVIHHILSDVCVCVWSTISSSSSSYWVGWAFIDCFY